MKNSTQEHSPRNEKIAFVILSAFLWIGAVCAGYFFEVAFLLLDAGLFLGLAIWLWLGRGTGLRITIWHGYIAAFIGIYWISCLYASDASAAIQEASKFSNLLPLAILASSLSIGKFDSLLRQWAWVGAFLTVWGWMFELFRNGRLESTLGYANSLAVLLAAGAYLSWKAFRENHGKIYIGLLVLQLVGLVQTGSRSVLVLFAVICCVELVRLRGKALFALLGILAGGAAIAVGLANSYSTEIFRRFSEISWNAPELQLRRQYWSDGLNLLKEHWVAGLGGGGWAVEHSSWYYVKYLHQFYLQVALEVGIVGLIAFLLVVFAPAYRSRETVLHAGFVWLLVGFLLLHVAVDIDFEYPLCFGLLVLLLARAESLNSLSWSGLQINRFMRLCVIFGGILLAVAFSILSVQHISV